MTEPDLFLLDEPAAGLDLGAREDLLVRLTAMAADSVAAIILVTHHLKEIPAGFDRAVVLTAGTVLASGPIEEVLTGASLSAACGLPLEVDARAGRFSAWAGASTR
jgi:iron complex transport system ATP-binding protein